MPEKYKSNSEEFKIPHVNLSYTQDVVTNMFSFIIRNVLVPRGLSLKLTYVTNESLLV